MVDAVFSDTATAKRTEHLRLEILKYYQNLRGKTGLQQQASILPNSENGCEGISINVPKLDHDKCVIVVGNTEEGSSSFFKIFDGELQGIWSVHGNTINITFNLETKE